MLPFDPRSAGDGDRALSIARAPGFSEVDLQALDQAVEALERTSFAARLTHAFGQPLDRAGAMLPAAAREAVSKVVAKALEAALRAALVSLGQTTGPARPRLHRSLAIATGAAGGAFGLPALSVELPASTTLILRSIADIARAEGEDLTDPEAGLACLEVFALGGRSPEDDYLDSGYFAVRGLLAQTVSEAARFVAQRGVDQAGAPVFVRLISLVGARFGINVTQKLAAQAVPIVGALGGGAVNYAFTTHYQALAQAHFAMRRLERTYGREAVRAEYDRRAAGRPRQTTIDA